MVLYDNSLITLTYDTSTDILTVEAPSLDVYEISLIRPSLDAITETLRNYNIKKVLYDPGNINMAIVPQDILDETSFFFTRFIQTNLKKFARIRTHYPIREVQVKDALDKLQLTYQFKNFDTQAEAMAWLTNPGSLS